MNNHDLLKEHVNRIKLLLDHPVLNESRIPVEGRLAFDKEWTQKVVQELEWIGCFRDEAHKRCRVPAEKAEAAKQLNPDDFLEIEIPKEINELDAWELSYAVLRIFGVSPTKATEQLNALVGEQRPVPDDNDVSKRMADEIMRRIRQKKAESESKDKPWEQSDWN